MPQSAGSPAPVLPSSISSITSRHHALGFWLSRGKREYQAGSNLEIKIYSLVKIKIQDANFQAWQQCAVEDSPADRLWVQRATRECSLHRSVPSQDGSGAHLQQHAAHSCR